MLFKHTFKHILTLTIVLIFAFLSISNAQDTDQREEVTIIYIHGVLNSDFMAAFNHANTMYQKIKDKHIGPYKIKDYKIAYWGALARNNDTFKLYYQGLMQMNYKHNRKHSVVSTLNPANLVTKPLEPKKLDFVNPKEVYAEDGTAFYNKGSDESAILTRSVTNDFAYDLVWLLSDNDKQGDIIDGIKYKNNRIGNNLEAVYNKIEDQINQTEGKYILLGDSAGCIAAVKFVMDVLNENSRFNRLVRESNSEKLYNTSEKSYINKFAGLITIASPVNTFLSADLEIAYKNYQHPQTRKQSFINFLINEKLPDTGKSRFWINIGHRNDPIATDISSKITSIKGDGFITSKITQATLKEKVVDKAIVFKISDSNVLKAHRWYLNHWVQIVDMINECFDEHKLERKLEK